jgi:hypothetical protein
VLEHHPLLSITELAYHSRNGELVVRSSRVTPTWDGRTARLEIEDLELEDAGMYTCVAENEMGRTRCSARLVVLQENDPTLEDKQAPVFLQNLPPEAVAVDGDMLELQVRLEGEFSSLYVVLCCWSLTSS